MIEFASYDRNAILRPSARENFLTQGFSCCDATLFREISIENESTMLTQPELRPWVFPILQTLRV